MKVRDLITRLQAFNQDADFEVLAHNYPQQFSITFGSSEGCTPETCDCVSLYLDSLCGSEEVK